MKTDTTHDRDVHERLKAGLRALGQAEPGPDFAARVMERVGSRAPLPRPRTRLGSVVTWLVQPRTLRVSPLGGLAAAACLLLALGLAFRSGTGGGLGGVTDAPQGLTPVTFVLAAPGAREVAVIGSFNGWNAAGWTMRHDGATGLWTLSAALPPGSHEYVFLVDGTTPVPDAAAALSADDGFGSRNSVLLVKHGDGSVL